MAKWLPLLVIESQFAMILGKYWCQQLENRVCLNSLMQFPQLHSTCKSHSNRFVKTDKRYPSATKPAILGHRSINPIDVTWCWKPCFRGWKTKGFFFVIEMNLSESGGEKMVSKTDDFKQVLKRDCEFPAGIDELLRMLVLHHARNDQRIKTVESFFPQWAD